MLKKRRELNNFPRSPLTPLKGQSFSRQKSIQFRLEGSPAPADFSGLDSAGREAFHVGRAGYFKILAGIFGGENGILAVSVFNYHHLSIQPAVGTITSVGLFAPVFTAATLQVAIAYHKCFLHFQPCVIKFGNILTLSHKAAFFIFNE